MNQNDTDILDRLQRLYFKIGNYKKSISLLRKLAKLSYGQNGPSYVSFQKKTHRYLLSYR